MEFPINSEIESFLNELGIEYDDLQLESDLYSMSNTNHLFKTSISHKKLVVRTNNDSNSLVIDRKAEEHNSKVLQDLGIGPKVCFSNRYKISEYLPATSHYDKSDTNHQREFCKSIATLHNSGRNFCSVFDPIRMGMDYLRMLKNPNSLSAEVEVNLMRMHEILLNYTSKHTFNLVPCQVDLVPENILYSDYDGKVYIIDQEYSGDFYAEWDLADLASECDMTEAEENNLRTQYSSESGRFTDFILYYICKALCNLLWAAWALYYEENEGNMMEYFLLRYYKYLTALSIIDGGDI